LPEQGASISWCSLPSDCLLILFYVEHDVLLELGEPESENGSHLFFEMLWFTTENPTL
jgi:hypothetical protein